MIDLLIAYDDNDLVLGDYFETSHNQIAGAGIENTTITSLRGLDCTEVNITDAINTFNGKSFVFVGLTHGDEDGETLLTDNDVFVSEQNAPCFKHSFFYSTACHIGRELKTHLLNGQCNCFIGYTDASYASYDEFHDVYIDCENYSINEFFKTDKTIEQTYTEMKEYFLQKIEHYMTAGEILFAMELERNMVCLIIEGNRSLTRNDFNN